MLSEISQTEKNKHCMTSLVGGILKKKNTKTELVDKDRLGLPDAGVGRTAKMGEGVKIVKRLKKKKCPVTR